MKEITATCDDSLKKFSSLSKSEKYNPEKKKNSMGSPTPTRRPSSPQSTSDTFCVYCKSKDHNKENCQKLKKKEQLRKPAQPSQPKTVATVERSSADSSSTVAYVKNIIADDSIIKVSAFNSIRSEEHT